MSTETKPTQFTTKGLVTAYLAGRRASEANQKGERVPACPYSDKRGGFYGNIVTGARAYIKKWQEGWKDAEAGLPVRYGERQTVHKCAPCGAVYPTKRECFAHMAVCEKGRDLLERQRAALNQ